MAWPVGPVDTRTKLDDLATPDDNRDLNATILRHGLLPKLSGSAGEFLNGLGQFSAASTANALATVTDSLFNILDDVTPGKIAQFQCEGLSPGTNVFTFPQIAAATLAVLEKAQTFTQPQIIDPQAVGDVPLKLVGQAGQTGNLFQVLDSASVVLSGFNAAGDLHGGMLTTDSLVMRSNDGGSNTRARVILSNTPDVRFDIEAGSVDPLVLSLGLVSGTLTGTALTMNLVDAGGNNSTITIDNRAGGTTPVPFTVYRSLIGSVANLTEWRSEADVIMSRIRSDGAFIGPIVAGATDVIDATFRILDDATPTKIARFENVGLPIGTNIFNFPPLVAAGTDTLAALGLAQTFTSPQTISSSTIGATRLTIQSAPGVVSTSAFLQFLDENGQLLSYVNSVGVPAVPYIFLGLSANNHQLLVEAATAPRAQILLNASGAIAIVGVDSDPPASGQVGKVNRTGQVANIAGPVNITNATPAGFYALSAYMVRTAVGTGTVSLNITYTDDSGVQTNIPITGVVMTGALPGTAHRVVHLLSGNITWNTTGYVSGTYSVRIRAHYLGS